MTSARSLAAIVFTDIVGYSAIVHRDEALGAKLLDRQRAVVRRIVPQYGGREVETAGDSFLLEFGSALAAVQAVIAIQKTLAADAASPAVVLRASVHLGDVEHRGREVFGDGINIAARLLPHSPEGGLALSAPVLGLISQRMELPVRSIGTPPLKNITRPVEIFTVEAGQLRELEVPSSEIPSQPAASHGRLRRLAAVSAIGALLLAAAVAWWRQPWRTWIPVDDRSIAVLPFANTSGDPANEYFSDGLSEELINTLGRLRDLKVIGRTSSFQFKNRTDDSRAIGEKLGVAYLLEGSVRKAADRVRIAVELMKAADGADIWSESYDRELKDIFAVQSEIAGRVAGQLKSALAGPGNAARGPRADGPPTGNIEAYRALLQGNFYDERRTLEDTRKAVGYYDQAIALDPEYAMAYARRARAEMDLWGHYVSHGDETGKYASMAHADIATAIKISPELPEAHIARAMALNFLDLDFAGAELAYRRAVDLAPQNPDASLWLGRLQASFGRFDEGIALIQRALQLDPLSARGPTALSILLMRVGRLDEAEATIRKGIEMRPQASDQFLMLTQIQILQGRPAASVDTAKRETDPMWRLVALALAQTALGNRIEADAALNRLLVEGADRWAYQIAEIYALRREPEKTFSWLDRAWANRDPGVHTLRFDAWIAVYKDDPRYAAFARKIGVMPSTKPAVGST